MSTYFTKLLENLDVINLKNELLAHPELWNVNNERLSTKGPHYQTDDIWIRYKDKTENVESSNWKNFADPHIPIWYPADKLLPSARAMTMSLMSLVGGEMLGGVLIYRVPPGKEILPHTDTGWHPEYFAKFNFALQSQEGCSFYYPDSKGEVTSPEQSMEARTGDLHWFKNTIPHGVRNDSKQDQLILTVCIRTNQFSA